jgi:hypothetical protein
MTSSDLILACVRILGGLPLPALEEALQELADIEKYYRKKDEASPPKAEETPISVALGRTYTRPEFPALED